MSIIGTNAVSDEEGGGEGVFHRGYPGEGRCGDQLYLLFFVDGVFCLWGPLNRLALVSASDYQRICMCFVAGNPSSFGSYREDYVTCDL